MARRDVFRAGMDEHEALRKRNKAKVQADIAAAGPIPESLDIDLSLFPVAHTQWMWGQLAAKLVRIGSAVTDARQGRRRNDVQGAQDLTEHERRWAAAAEALGAGDAAALREALGYAERPPAKFVA